MMKNKITDVELIKIFPLPHHVVITNNIRKTLTNILDIRTLLSDIEYNKLQFVPFNIKHVYSLARKTYVKYGIIIDIKSEKIINRLKYKNVIFELNSGNGFEGYYLLENNFIYQAVYGYQSTK